MRIQKIFSECQTLDRTASHRYDEINILSNEVINIKLIDKLERKLCNLRIFPFFSYLVFAMGGVYILDLIFSEFFLISRMELNAQKVLSGQPWRLITFLFIPPNAKILQTVITLYFLYFIGTTLERRWGARRFFIYYIIGTIAAIIAGMLTGYGTNYYLNLSLFFSFAILYPDAQVLLFFVLPIKVKWLALLNGVVYLYDLIHNPWPIRAAIIASLINLILFLGGDILNQTRTTIQQWRRRQIFRNRSK